MEARPNPLPAEKSLQGGPYFGLAGPFGASLSRSQLSLTSGTSRPRIDVQDLVLS